MTYLSTLTFEKPTFKRLPSLILALPLLCWMLPGSNAQADGFSVDKLYHPYVEVMKQEIEWRVVSQNKAEGESQNSQTHFLGYGRAFGTRWFGEVYLIGDKKDNQSLELESYEVEALWQLSEQGEYWADWGMLFELEKEDGLDIWEGAVGILMEKETGRISTLLNATLIQEWGSDIKDEIESSLGIQTRYRYSSVFEPGIEFHSGQDTRALGPVFQGDIRLGQGKSFHWELGIFAGLDSNTPDSSVRGGIEYEF